MRNLQDQETTTMTCSTTTFNLRKMHRDGHIYNKQIMKSYTMTNMILYSTTTIMTTTIMTTTIMTTTIMTTTIMTTTIMTTTIMITIMITTMIMIILRIGLMKNR